MLNFRVLITCDSQEQLAQVLAHYPVLKIETVLSDDLRKAAAKLLDQGLSETSVAQIVGVVPATLKGWAKLP